MDSKKNKTGSNQELYRICPSTLTKHELEDLYFTVLETNIQLRKTINEQQEKIKALSTKMQVKISAQKVNQAEERKNCCVNTDLKIKQQKETIDGLRRAHERTAERIRKLNTQVCSGNRYTRFSPYCAQKAAAKWAKNNESFKSVGTQTEFPRDETMEPVDTQTELEPISNKHFISVGTQTDLPRYETLQPEGTQTEVVEPMETAHSVNSVQTSTKSPKRNVSLVSVETQTESMSKNPYKYYEIEGRVDTLCDEDKCRTLMDELKQKINSLVEELAKTHREYSARISRLEVEVQEYRKENMNGSRGYMVAGQEGSLPSESYWNQLVNNLKFSAGYAADLKVQLAKEKRKVAELESQLRDAQLNSLGKNETPSDPSSAPRRLLNGNQQENREPEEIAAEQDDNTWICNCGHLCPNTQCPFKDPKHTSPSIYKHECTSTCYSQIRTPFNSFNSLDNNVREQQSIFDGRKNVDITDPNKDQNLPRAETSQKLSDINNSQYPPNIEKIEDLTYQPKNVPDTNKVKRLYDVYDKRNSIMPSNDLNVLDNKKVRDTVETYSNLNYNMISRKKVEVPPNANRIQTVPVANGGSSTDNKNRDMSDSDKVDKLSDAIENAENNNEEDIKEYQRDIFNYNKEKKGYENGLPKTNAGHEDNQNIIVSTDDNKMSYDKAYINEIKDTIDANAGQSGVGTQKRQFQLKDKKLSVESESYENRQMAGPDLLVKSLKDINEEQTKTVAELSRQINNSQKSISGAKTQNALKTNVNKNIGTSDVLHHTKNNNKNDMQENPEEIFKKNECHDSRGQSPAGTQKRQLQLKDKKLPVESESHGNRRTASSDLLGENPIDINEKQTKTVPELRRQINSSQKSLLGAKSESALKTNVVKKIETSDMPQDTICLMRVLSTLAENSEEEVGKGATTDVEFRLDNSQKPQQPNVGENETRSKKSFNVPEETISLLRLVSTVGDSIHSNITDREKTPKSHEDVQTQKYSAEPATIKRAQHKAQAPSAPTENRNKYLHDNRRTSKNIHQLNKEQTNTEPNEKSLKEPLKATKQYLEAHNIENVPTKDKIIEMEKNERDTEMYDAGRISSNSMTNLLHASSDFSKCFKSVDKFTQVESVPEKLVVRDNHKDVNVASTPMQREIATYRRNSGTLCFKTVPASKRSQLCQCNEQFHCEMAQSKSIQTESKYLQANCATGYIKCTRDIAPKNIYSQILTSTLSGAVANLKSNDIGTNTRNKYSHKASTDSSREIKNTLQTVAEELARYKELSQQSSCLETGVEIQNTLDTKASEEVLNEFDAGCQHMLKRGLAMHSVNEIFSPKCAFVLHIGTVVLSDEAVLICRGKSLGLTWKFYDQDLTTTQMRAGRVVVFNFSSEYELNLTDKFLNYMKHDELQILICQLEEPNRPIASCSLPLRDALLNTNRRVDMSLALVAGPQMIYARQVNNAVSDVLDAGDEMGVLDLWCMLRAEAQFVPLINKAIAWTSKPPLVQGPKTCDLESNEIKMKATDIEIAKKENKWKSQQDDEFLSLHRWGSSVLQLPSKEVSKQSMDKNKQDNISDIQSDDDIPENVIINEVFANIRTSDDMKRVLNRESLRQEQGMSDRDSLSTNFKKRAQSQQKLRDLSSSSSINNMPTDSITKKYKKIDTDSNLSQETSQGPAVLLPRSSLGSKRSDINDINKKYDNISKLYTKLNSQKNDGTRVDQSRKQVKINPNRAVRAHEDPQRDKPEEQEQTIDITVLWLALNEECEAMLSPRVQRVYVAYEFLGRSGADLETPVSLPKPKHYVDKCYFNFRKTFQIDKNDMEHLGEMARCRATSQVSKANKDCIIFSVISEPPEDPLGLDVCEDIGYAYLYLGDLMAYSAGSSGYTEVVPVRSRNGTSVCGVLAVRLDGLDVLRRCLQLVDSKMTPRIE